MSGGSLQDILDRYNDCVFMISKDGCKYCDYMEADMKEMDIPYTNLKLGDQIQQEHIEELKTRFNHKTYPMLFFGKNFVGGYDAFSKLCYTSAIYKKLKDELGLEVDPDF